MVQRLINPNTEYSNTRTIENAQHFCDKKKKKNTVSYVKVGVADILTGS